MFPDSAITVVSITSAILYTSVFRINPAAALPFVPSVSCSNVGVPLGVISMFCATSLNTLARCLYVNSVISC